MNNISYAFYPVKNTKLAAALMSVGVSFSRNDDPVTNMYSKDRPFRPGQPGEVTYHLANESVDGEKTSDLVAEWEQGDADKRLDALADEICKADPVLGARLKKLLPAAQLVAIKGGLENRERLASLWKNAPPMMLVRKGAKSFSLVYRNASEALKKQFAIH